MNKRLVLIAIITLSAVGLMSALPPTVTARLDSATLLMGKMTVLQLQTVTDANQKGEFPMLATATQDGLISLLNDTVELRAIYKADTVAVGSGRSQINYHFPLQAFIPGTYILPEFAFVVGGDTVYSNKLVLKVIEPQPALKSTDSIAPDVPPLGPYYNSSIEKLTDKIPDFLWRYWWIIFIGILILAALTVYIIKHRGKVGTQFFKRTKPELPPYERALRNLKILRDAGLWENGQEKEYFSRLTEILREYLQGRFGINAMEMTSSEIVKAVSDIHEARKSRQYMDRVMEIADFVKFAKMRPLPDDNISAFENALKFIEETKPVVVPPDTEAAAGASAGVGNETSSN